MKDGQDLLALGAHTPSSLTCRCLQHYLSTMPENPTVLGVGEHLQYPTTLSFSSQPPSLLSAILKAQGKFQKAMVIE